MAGARSDSTAETTYALGAVSRLTGLSAEVLRAWERRYGAVRPARTPGGTRRYRARDLERLRLLKAAVDAGHRIGEVVGLEDEELARRAHPKASAADDPIRHALAAIARFDAAEAQRLLALQLSALGPTHFATQVAAPLVREVGERWADGTLSIAGEHLASGVLRAMLGSALQPGAAALIGPRIVFATPAGERHELGLQMAALTAMGAGAAPIYLGADLPDAELLLAVERTKAAALALSLVSCDGAARSLAALRAKLPSEVQLWIGGARAASLPPIGGVECIPSLEALEARVVRLGFEKN